MRRKEPVNAEAAILGRLLGPSNPTLSAAAAQALLDLDFPQDDRVRMDLLAAKAREGTLTAAEQSEIESYGWIGTFLSVLRSRARMALKQFSSTNGPAREHVHEPRT